MQNDRTIILVSGPLGVGKSSLCKMIFDTFGFSLIDGDSFFGPLENANISWKERLKRSWDWIVEQTKANIGDGKSVVIDFVVEDELPWFLDQISELEAKVKYVVLIAEEGEVKQRLEKRDGGLQYFERSKVLLTQLQSDPNNKLYLLDTTNMNTREVMDQIMTEERFNLR